MSTLGKRVDVLEKHQGLEHPGSCLVLVRPGEDADQRRMQEVSAFIAKHGHEPRLISVVTFVKPPPREE